MLLIVEQALEHLCMRLLMGLVRPVIEQHFIRMEGQGRLTQDRAHVTILDKPLLEDWQANTELSSGKEVCYLNCHLREG